MLLNHSCHISSSCQRISIWLRFWNNLFKLRCKCWLLLEFSTGNRSNSIGKVLHMVSICQKQLEYQMDFQVKQLKIWLRNKQLWMYFLKVEFGQEIISQILSPTSSKILPKLISKTLKSTSFSSRNIIRNILNLKIDSLSSYNIHKHYL